MAALHGARHFASAQQIHQGLARTGVRIGLSTVYRVLAALAASGEVDVQTNHDGESVYRRCGESHHHHLVCRECGHAVEIAASEVEQWARRVGRNHGFTSIDHTIELRGLCRDCR